MPIVICLIHTGTLISHIAPGNMFVMSCGAANPVTAQQEGVPNTCNMGVQSRIIEAIAASLGAFCNKMIQVHM